MSAQEISSLLMSGEGRLIVAAVLFLVVFLLRKYKNYGPLSKINEFVVLAIGVLPIAAASLAAGAPLKDVIATVITAVLVAGGWQSLPLGSTEVTAPTKPATTDPKPEPTPDPKPEPPSDPEPKKADDKPADSP